ncbi:PREDICTED: nucleolin 1-like [Camelina sativa]|uniref:Nucleolin 1-like n=1 Tax=Camelina sativa TaxID=90675 RepID=A0ABM0U5Z5_CAMSA|nr:PREDICTED: nucleolin 1-like [Camelina sativa]
MGKSSKKYTTKVEADPAIIKTTKPLKKGKREAEDDLETKVKLKKQKKNQKKESENKETMDFLQLMEAKMDLLITKVDLLTSKVDSLATTADLQEILTSLKEVVETNGSLTAKAESSSSEDESEDDSQDDKVILYTSDEEPSKDPVKDSSSSSDSSSEDDSQDDKASNVNLLRQKAAPPTSKAASSSYLAVKDSDEEAAENGNIAAFTPPQSSVQTIYVEGFGSSLPEDDIKTALSEHFSTCGEITRVFVPTSFLTGSVKGFAYIDLKEDAKKALELNGSVMIGKELVVKKALIMRDPYTGHSGSNLGSGGRFGGRFGSVGGRYGGGRCGGFGMCRRC